MGKGSACRALGSVMLLGAVALAGCGGGGKSGTPTASTTTSASAQKVKQVNLHLVRSGSAEAPRQSMLVRVADLLGWPQVAEASTGVQGCTVSAGGGSAVTDVNGNATLTSVNPFTFVTVTCPPSSPANVPLMGPAGAVVTAEIETNNIEVRVRNQRVSEPKVSEPSTPSKPSKLPGTTTQTSSNHHGSGDDD